MAAELPVAPAALPGPRPEPGPASAPGSRSRPGPESASGPRPGPAPQSGSGPGPEPAPGPSRPPADRGQEKRARPEGPSAAAPQQKRSRTALGTGAAKTAPKAPPRTPLRSLCPAAAAGKNNGSRKAASVGPAPRTGSTTSTGARSASKRSPWDLRGKVAYLREALRQAQEELRQVQEERQEVEVCVCQQRERLQQQERELEERETRESSLCARIGSLEWELSQCREELQLNQRRVAALEAEQRQLEAEKQQREQERDAALSQAQALTKELDSTWVKVQETQQQLQEKLQELSVLQEQEASERALLVVYEDRILQLEMERRRLHNDIQELRGNIRVFCRVRPLLPEEEERQQGLPHLHFPSEDPRSLLLTRPDDSQVGRERRADLRYYFSFDRVFPPLASQQDIFQEIQLLVQSALDGFPVCIFAYGQTGSGKTFTMEGPAPPGSAESRGMIPRAVRQLFLGAQDLAGKGWQYVFSASYLEIYNESLRDLLLARGEPPPELEIRRLAPNSDELHVPNLTWVPVQSEEQVLELLLRAGSQRSVARTGLNERSSRSHSVFQLRIQGHHAASDLRCTSTLTLVDLAGSERLERSHSVGNRLRETQSINSSLSNLGRVISALCNKEAHIPYRDSKLTFLLQNCLGGHAKVLMIVTISPMEEDLGESLNSLRFASKVNDCMIGTAQANRK